MCGRSVRRTGDHERGLSEVFGGEQGGELAGVAVEHPTLVLDAVFVSEREVGAGDVDPVRFVLDADRASSAVQRFDKGGADSAHGVEH